MRPRALILDFGGPVLVTPFELVEALEVRVAVPRGTFGWTGPFDPESDPLWRKLEVEDQGQVTYWEIRAQEFAEVTGFVGVRQLMSQLYPVEEIASSIRRQAYQTVRAARSAGLRTAVLTNDLASFYSDDWIGRIGFLNEVDAVVDGSRTGVLKPDPAAYRAVLCSLGVSAEEAVFVDDHPPNVLSARALGMSACFFDVTRPWQCYQTVHQMLGLQDSDLVK